MLNARFVPVYTSNEDYRKEGPAPADERALLGRIQSEAGKAKLSVGTVHAYVLTPEGKPVDSLHVAEACKPERLMRMLEGAAKSPEGPPVVAPTRQSVAPKVAAGSLVLHLTARSLDGKGCWGYFPVEDWITLSPEEASKLTAAPETVSVGDAWTVDTAVSLKLLTRFYPATENNDIAKNEIEHQQLKAMIVSSDGFTARVRFDGLLKMRHPFYHKKDEKVAEATIVGFADFDIGRRRIRSLALVTEKATYGGGLYGIAVRLGP